MSGPFDDTEPLTPFEDLLNTVVAALDGRVNSGTIRISDLGTATTYTTGSIPHGCDGVPTIVPGVGPDTHTSPIFGPIIVRSVDATNFVLTIQKADGSALANQDRWFSWHAIVPTP